MTGYPFEKFADLLRDEGERLLDLYSQPGIVECHQAVRDLWDLAPSVLAATLAGWWECTKIVYPANVNSFLPRHMADGTPEDIAAGFSWDMVNNYPESGRYRLREFLQNASYRDTCTLVDTVAEWVLKARGMEDK